jgi:uncharacterized sulfatase
MLTPLLLAAAAQTFRPNIVWISLEDVGAQFGAYGDEAARTPVIDALAERGLRFDRAFATTPVCAPSRSAVITGAHPLTLGTMHMRSRAVPPPQVRPFTELLRAAGYWCTNNDMTDYQFPPPRTAWDVSSNAATWKDRPDKSQPFFAVFNLFGSHESQVWPTAEPAAARRAALPAELRPDPARLTPPPYWPDTPAVREDMARHYGNVAVVDQQAGAILKELAEAGELQRTIVMVWGDHGWGMPRGKRWLYESGIRVPLIMAGPGLGQGVREDLASLMDLGPTVLSLAGIDPPEWMEGRALAGFRQGIEPEALLVHRDRMDEVADRARGFRTRRWKYIRNYLAEVKWSTPLEYAENNATLQEWRRAHSAGELNEVQAAWFARRRPHEELYDLQADPFELTNLAEDPAHLETMRDMRLRLRRWERSGRDLGAIPEAELQRRFFPTGEPPRTARPTLKLTSEGVVLECETPGAAIAWRWEGETVWRLYSAPILPTGRPRSLEARANRLGWDESLPLRAAAG